MKSYSIKPKTRKYVKDMGFYQLQEIYVTNTGHTGLGALKQLRKN